MTSPPPAGRKAWWTVAPTGGGIDVALGGQFDEQVDFSELRPLLRGRVVLDLAAVTRMNSTGVRQWVDLVHDLPGVSELVYARCSPAVVTQINTIYNFRGPARVASLLGPYLCEHCELEATRLIDLEALPPGRLPELSTFPCPRCGAAMAFDDLPERYFSFLTDG